LLIKLRFVEMPRGASWPMLYGVAILTGIGFTMSLFIGSLAFDATSSAVIVTDRLGILVGSLLSAVFGYIALEAVLPRTPSDHS
jgi:NhaA family Na+:H+ antiporter